VVALLSALLCAYAAFSKNFWLLCAATVVAGYYNANAGLYRFAAAEVAGSTAQEKAVSLVMAGGLMGAVAGPNLAAYTRNLFEVPFAGAYMALAGGGVAGHAGAVVHHISARAPQKGRAAGPATSRDHAPAGVHRRGNCHGRWALAS
jgi:predicted MFS family arabinose efflux permease